jgi:hypothetical protein
LSDLEHHLDAVRLRETLKRVMMAAVIGVPFVCLLVINLVSNILFSPATGYYIPASGSLAAGSITSSSMLPPCFFVMKPAKFT